MTVDVHCYPNVEKEITLLLEETLKIFNNLSIKATFFCPADFVEQFSPYVRMILDEGHEIGCHSLTHNLEEEYNSMPYEKQKAILHEAKERIEEIVVEEVISFRAPAFKINGNTIKALEENGFKIDSSVNPQRLGILSSDVTNIGWMYSPRKPYHPSFNNPFIIGKASLWEIPQSAFIFPFMSNTAIAFGEVFMKLFFRMLHFESSISENPIVYMFHPEDIYAKGNRGKYKFAWKHLLPSKKMGFEARNILFNKGSEKISRRTINLLQMMKNSKNTEFITFKKMLDLLESENKD